MRLLDSLVEVEGEDSREGYPSPRIPGNVSHKIGMPGVFLVKSICRD